MILCKYQKKSAAVYTPHLAFMRGVTMAIRRAGLQIGYSEGFNPHPLIYFAPPTPVGTASECEYFSAVSSESPEIFMEKLNKTLQPSVEILKVSAAVVNPNFAHIAFAAEYEIDFEKAIELPSLQEILKAQNYFITYEQKGETVSKDARPLIHDLKGSGKTYLFTLASGNPNLRADRLMNQLLKAAGQEGAYYSVTKKRTFAKDFQDFDALFFKETSELDEKQTTNK